MAPTYSLYAEIVPTLAKGFRATIQKDINKALNVKPLTVKVQPELATGWQRALQRQLDGSTLKIKTSFDETAAKARQRSTTSVEQTERNIVNMQARARKEMEADFAKREKNARALAAMQIQARKEMEKEFVQRAKLTVKQSGGGAGDTAGDIAGAGGKFFTSAGEALSKAFQGGFASILRSPALTAGIAVIGASAAVVIGPIITAAVSSAIGVGLATAGIGAGIAIAFQDPRIKLAFGSLKTSLMAQLSEAASGFIGPLTVAFSTISARLGQNMGTLTSIFNTAASYLNPLVDGLMGFVEKVLPGIRTAMENIRPVVEVLSQHLPKIGAAIGQFFADVTSEGANIAGTFSMILTWIENVIIGLGQFIKWVNGATDNVVSFMLSLLETAKTLLKFSPVLKLIYGPMIDQAAESYGAWDKAIKDAEGSMAAFAGTASTTTKAISANKVMSQSQADVYTMLTDVQKKLNEEGATTESRITALATAGQKLAGTQGQFGAASYQMAQSLMAEADAAQLATDKLAGYNAAFGIANQQHINAMTTSVSYQASRDALTKSFQENGATLDIATEKGRANTTALQASFAASHEKAKAEIADGASVRNATAAERKRNEAITAQAIKHGANAKQVRGVAAAYKTVPSKATTAMGTVGLPKVYEDLANAYYFQRALQEGKTVAQAKALANAELGAARASAGKQGAKVGPGFNPQFDAATGGYISGEGGPTADKIPAMLSNGEYVVRAGAVQQLGVPYMNAINYADKSGVVPITSVNLESLNQKAKGKKIAGRYPGDGSEGAIGLRFAIGGPVTWPYDIKASAKVPTHASIIKRFGDPATTGTGSVLKAKQFLKAQNNKPYIWASAGPAGYDCSGIVSAAYNVLKGKNPYSHTFSTMNQAGFFPKQGWNRAGLTAGWSNAGERGGGSVGHTAGELAGLPFESGGSWGKVHVGSGATPVSSFAHVGHFAQGGLVKRLLASAQRYERMRPGSIPATTRNILKARGLRARASAIISSVNKAKAAARARALANAYNDIRSSRVSKGNLAYARKQSSSTIAQWAVRTPHSQIGRVYSRLAIGQKKAFALAYSQRVARERIAQTRRGQRSAVTAATAATQGAAMSSIRGALGMGGGGAGAGILGAEAARAAGARTVAGINARYNTAATRAGSVAGLTGSGVQGRLALDDYTISRLAQASATKPTFIVLDSKVVASSVSEEIGAFMGGA